MFRCTRVKIFTGYEDDIYALATFPDGERIATGSVDGTIRIRRFEDDREMNHLVERNTLYWQPWVRDAETGKVVAGPLDGHINAVFTLDISPDDERIATGSADRTIRIWRLEDGREMKKWVVKNGVRTLVILRDGKQVVSAEDDDLVIRCLDTFTWKQAGVPWIGHDRDITRLTHLILNPVGTLLASTSIDNTVRLWQIQTSTELALYEHSDNNVFSVAFSVDGRFIFSRLDEQILRWKIPEGLLAAASGDVLVEGPKTEANTFNCHSAHKLTHTLQLIYKLILN
ncbi:WD40 repeat-like protein [Rhizopogon vinicolor AM-OR11-026]|uniref:WD40 repeat-like protein n=1 Tax=Rhizopogon vinicolor AM-OR11-026 TaxID=1314800 RepID=A0A1B7MWZ2_9AGAM|nr:WD40 repeat-like protein [Rhizopogon vinicolor AM-OR11-026]